MSWNCFGAVRFVLVHICTVPIRDEVRGGKKGFSARCGVQAEG
jgi:hypothetical protein